jgi:hypothetical protein
VVGFPVAAEIRQARGDAVRAVRPAVRVLRGPVLSLLGAGEVAVDGWSALNSWGRGELPMSRFARWRMNPTYGELVDRGEGRLQRLSARPEIISALRRGQEATTVWNKRVEAVADELNDRSEEALARLELRIREARGSLTRHRRGSEPD